MEPLLNRPRLSTWQQFLRSPLLFLARKLYALRRTIPYQTISDPVTIVCVSDTHNSQPALPDGDILIHAGDLTQGGTLKELQVSLDWLKASPHRHKIVVAGNHDMLLDLSLDAKHQREQLDWGDITYLQNESTVVTCENGRSLLIYGSPYTPKYGNWAFQYLRSEDKWTGKVPLDVDILVTHGPPRAHLDLMNLGCDHLLQELWRARPRLHVFGHIHEGYGQEWLGFDEMQTGIEGVVMNSGWSRLVSFVELVVESVRGWFSPSTEAKCLLVNAAMVGGLWDQERRRPVTVML